MHSDPLAAAAAAPAGAPRAQDPIDASSALGARLAGLEAAYPASARLRLRLAGVPIEVASNEPALIDALQSYYDELCAPPGDAEPPAVRVVALEAPPLALAGPTEEGERLPGKKPKERFLDLAEGRVIHKVRTGMVYLVSGDEHLAVGPCLANEPQVVNFVNNRFIERRLWQGCLLAHAAAVSRKGRGLAVCGFSGAGKSTLALHLMSRGVDFVSNDRLLLDASAPSGVRIDGVPKHPRVNPGTLLGNPDLASVLGAEERERFRALPAGELWTLEHKYDARIDRCFGPGRFPMTAALAALFVLRWDRASEEPTRFERVDLDERRDLLPAVMKAPGLFFRPRPGHRAPTDDDYVRALGRVTVYEATGRLDFDAGVAQGLAVLGG